MLALYLLLALACHSAYAWMHQQDERGDSRQRERDPDLGAGAAEECDGDRQGEDLGQHGRSARPASRLVQPQADHERAQAQYGHGQNHGYSRTRIAGAPQHGLHADIRCQAHESAALDTLDERGCGGRHGR